RFQPLLRGILRVHVEDEVDTAISRDEARQQKARQHALARTRPPEDTVRAFHELAQIDTDGRFACKRLVQLARRADDKVVLVFLAEHRLIIARARPVSLAEW